MAAIATKPDDKLRAGAGLPMEVKIPPPAPSPHALKINAMPWFHGKISRDEAEKLLQAPTSPDGVFLVRESTNFPGDYTLCVCFQGKVEHYRVIARNSRLTIDEEEYFENLTQLVEHYKKDADGLCAQLTSARKHSESSKPYHDVDLQAFRDAGWVIDDSEVKIHEKIGKGEFGDVMLGYYRDRKVAIKTMKDLNTRRMHQFLAEATVMTALKHDNLVCLLGIILNESSSMKIVTEYMSKGSLLEYLRSRGRQFVTKIDQIQFSYDTCLGMAYLESQSIIHRDLAARNVLISETGRAKVSDFGLALHNFTFLESGKLPIKWTAPEALRTQRFSSKSDMWSFGVLLWEIYSYGRVPYPRIPLAEVVNHVEKGYRMEAPEGCPPAIYDVMKKAWEIEPERRPSFDKVSLVLKAMVEEIDRGGDLDCPTES